MFLPLTDDRAGPELGVLLQGVEPEIPLEESDILGHDPPGFILLFLGDLQDQNSAVYVNADLSLGHRLLWREVQFILFCFLKISIKMYIPIFLFSPANES